MSTGSRGCWLAAALGVALCGASPAAPPTELAIAYSNRNFEKAAILARALAAKGDRQAQYVLGMMLHDGEGMAQDYGQALKWLRKAADAGDAGAQDLLGIMYAEGHGVRPDPAEALRWCKVAAANGSRSSMANLGTMYATGRGVEKDPRQAMKWYRTAAKAGLVSVYYDIGAMYFQGEGLEPDPIEAYAWWTRAVAKGHEKADAALRVASARMTPEQIQSAKLRAQLELEAMPTDTFERSKPKGLERDQAPGDLTRKPGRDSAAPKAGSAEYFLLRGISANKFIGAATAIGLWEQGLPLARKLGDKEMEAAFAISIGNAYHELGQLASAISFFEMSLAAAKEGKNPADESAALGNLGIVYMDLGDYAKALDLQRRVYEMGLESGDVEGQRNALGNLGLIFIKLGDYTQALKHLNASLDKSIALRDKNGVSGDLEALGSLYENIGEQERALKFYAKAIEIERDIGLSTARAELRTGVILMGLGELPRALEIFERFHHPVYLGQYYLKTGDFTKAKKNFTAIHDRALTTGSGPMALAGQLGLALTAEASGDAGGGRAGYDQALALLERQRELLPLASRGRFLAGRDWGFLRIAAYQGRARTAETAADAFVWAESAKARVFTEALTQRLRAGAPEISMKAAGAESEIAQRLATLYKQQDLAFGRKDAELRRDIEPKLTQAKKEQSGFIAKLRRDHPEYAAVQYPQPLRPEQTALRPGEVLLEYMVSEAKTLLFVLKANEPARSFEVPASEETLRRLVLEFRRPLEEPTDARKRFTGEFAAEAGVKLRELLLKPAAPFLEESSKIIIVPDGALGLLPFEALPAASGADASSLSYFGDSHDVAYAQSATALTLARTLRKGRGAGKGILIAADPIFGRSDPRLDGAPSPEPAAKPESAPLTPMGVKGTTGEALFDRLPQTGALAESLARELDGATVLTGRDASKARLLKENLSRYRYLVFATHGILDSDVSYIREPALVWNQIGNGENDDGFLTMSEIMGLKLDADLVALTACKTGLGKQVGGEGVMGLGRAFQYAGARNVLVSLWSVAEESTTKLTDNFFLNLKAGKTPREALKLARVELRKDKRYDHPFFWAPFILMGE